MNTPTFDPDAARSWLQILHGESQGYIHIVPFGEWSGRSFAVTDIDAAVDYIAAKDSTGVEAIYVRITSLRAPVEPGKRGGAADSATLPALWADVDIAGPGHKHQPCPADCAKPHKHKLPLPPDEDTARRIIAESGLPEPTIWIHSGGGLYPIWLLKPAHHISDLDDIKSLAAGWQKVIGHAAEKLGWDYGTGVGDLARVLRIPGTINRKEGLARPCRIVDASPRRYTLKELQVALADALATLPQPEPTVGVGDSLGDGTPPGRDYNNRTDWADILQPHGWRLFYTRGNVRYWTRPGKTTGVSATTNALGTDRLHVFSENAHPFDAGTSYSKFGAYALLEHGGDFKAAAKALAERGYGDPIPDPADREYEAFRDLLGKDVEPDKLKPTIVKRSWDDIGNAERLADHAGRQIRWVIDAEKWAVYTGTHWAIEGGATLVLGHVRTMLDALPTTEALEYDDTPRLDGNGRPKPSIREDFLTFVGRQRFQTRMVAATVVARTIPRIQARMSQFDTDPMLLNCLNGVVDLRTGELVSHKPELMLLSIAGAPYVPDAKAPMWTQFLARVMPEQERRDYLARVVGYTLTGSIDEQAIFVHHGSGANGKSVFMRVVRALAGTYGQSVPQSTLLAKSGEGIPNDVARMVGKRLLITSETGAGKRLDDELVKRLTGGEEISARFMRGEYFEFTPVGKIHLMTNYLPNVGSGHGIARRLQDIGWDVTIPKEEQDKTLAERIIAQELPGVLAWAVRGCLEWQQRGLDVPESVRQKTAEHIYDSDPLAQWLDERTDRDESVSTETHELYVDYREWVEERGTRAMTEKSFVMALDERGFTRGKDNRTRRSVINGIRLLPRVFEGGWSRVA